VLAVTEARSGVHSFAGRVERLRAEHRRAIAEGNRTRRGEVPEVADTSAVKATLVPTGAAVGDEVSVSCVSVGGRRREGRACHRHTGCRYS
jgi:hypothetical protein